jgi:hypothetical protein
VSASHDQAHSPFPFCEETGLSANLQQIAKIDTSREPGIDMLRQTLDPAGRTFVRPLVLRVLLGFAGAFALTALGWLFSVTVASAEEESPPPVMNILDQTAGTLDTVSDTVHAVATTVLPPPPEHAASSSSVVDSVHAAVDDLGKSLRVMVDPPVPQPSRISAGSVKTSTASMVWPPSVPRAAAVAVSRPVAVKALSPVAWRPAPPPVVGQQPKSGPPAAPGPVLDGGQWNVPTAPTNTGGAGGFHTPDAPVFATTSSARDAGLPVVRASRPAGPFVFRVVNAQPGVTPD